MSSTAEVSSTDVAPATRLSLRSRVVRIEDLRARNVFVVQRTHRVVLQAILQNPDRWPAHSAVMVDRRHRERRVRIQQVTSERRRSQRRAEPPAT
jgi:hypothetical protein